MIKYAVIYNYNRTGKLKSDGKASVLIRAYLDKKNKFLNTGVYVKPDQWDNKNHRVKNHPNQFHLNRAIKDQLEAMEAFEFEVIRRTGTITLDRIGDYSKDGFNITFTEFYEQQLKQCTFRKPTIIGHRQTFFKLQAFKDQILFSELDFKFINDFDTFLHGLDLSINTIAKHHKNLKKYINLAINCNYLELNKHPYRRFKVKKEITERICLTEFELSQIEGLYIPNTNETHRQIRDCFLFCCYTGLRFSDASNIRADNLNITDDGIDLYFVAEKTNKPLLLPLRKLFGSKPENLIRTYLEKYEAFYYEDISRPLPIFFGWTNQYVNRELKKIVKNLKIRKVVKKNITMHVARHTFGTIMAGKVKLPVLQKLMQHSRPGETMIYVHLNQQLINQALDKVKW